MTDHSSAGFVALVGEELAAAGTQAAAQCRDAGIALETIAEFRAAERKFLRTVPERFIGLAQGWRLGVLLVDEHGTLWRAGSTLRAAVPAPHKGYTAESARQRDALRYAAVRGGFSEGSVVNYDAELVVPESINEVSTPLFIRWAADGSSAIRVLWAAGAPRDTAPTLTSYLRERLELFIRV